MIMTFLGAEPYIVVFALRLHVLVIYYGMNSPHM
jgi:hypothetical protein